MNETVYLFALSSPDLLQRILALPDPSGPVLARLVTSTQAPAAPAA